jgi:hypothetical protein
MTWLRHGLSARTTIWGTACLSQLDGRPTTTGQCADGTPCYEVMGDPQLRAEPTRVNGSAG